MTYILGIDPGVKGGIAFLDPDAATLTVGSMPTYELTRARKKTFVDSQMLASIFLEPNVSHAYLEEVGAMPTDGVASAFSFGMNYGVVIGVLGGAQIPRTLVKPSVWKTRMRAPADKAQSVARAKELFPACCALFVGPRGGLKDGEAEAAMLSLFGALEQGYTIGKRITPL